MTTMTEETVHTMDIKKSVQIAADVEVAWEALLEELGPGSVMPDGKPFPMKIEPVVGGRWFRDLGNNSGHLWGHVQVIKPPGLLELIGPMPMSFPAINHVQYRLKAEGGGPLLTLHHRGMSLFPADFHQGMPDGWEQGVKRIKMIAEQKQAKKKGGAR